MIHGDARDDTRVLDTFVVAAPNRGAIVEVLCDRYRVSDVRSVPGRVQVTDVQMREAA